MKALNKKGFTLSELLIVMAIVVVLAAIAVPTFTKQLETARETADAELIRTALEDSYTQAVLYGSQNGNFDGLTTLNVGKGGKWAYDISSYGTISQTEDGFTYVTPKFAVGGSTQALDETVKFSATNKYVQFTYSVSDNKVTLTKAEALSALPTS